MLEWVLNNSNSIFNTPLKYPKHPNISSTFLIRSHLTFIFEIYVAEVFSDVYGDKFLDREMSHVAQIFDPLWRLLGMGSDSL